jgi:CrcB protein
MKFPSAKAPSQTGPIAGTSVLAGLSPVEEFLAIGIGGAAGACLRHAVHVAFGMGPTNSLWALIVPTLLVNLSGAGALGFLVGHITKQGGPAWLRPFFAVGVLGSFTTYSSVIFQNDLLRSELGLLAAVVHLIGTGAMGLLAFALGQASVRDPR